jgi:L-lactate dehydrogenase complex protein LldE
MSESTAAASRPRVYLFATCLVDLFWPQAGMDAIAVLEYAGFEVEFPRNQTCCGQPAYTTGFPDESRAVIRSQLGLFPEPIPIVVPSGSCAGMIQHHWPRIFADEPDTLARVSAISSRVVELTDFIVDKIDFALLQALPAKVCLHTSCSARRETGALSSGRKVLSELPGVALLTQDHEAECCGFGGTFCIKHPEISAAMAADKVDALLAAGCDVFVSGDCGCLQKRGVALRGRHLASLLRERLP